MRRLELAQVISRHWDDRELAAGERREFGEDRGVPGAGLEVGDPSRIGTGAVAGERRLVGAEDTAEPLVLVGLRRRVPAAPQMAQAAPDPSQAVAHEAAEGAEQPGAGTRRRGFAPGEDLGEIGIEEGQKGDLDPRRHGLARHLEGHQAAERHPAEMERPLAQLAPHAGEEDPRQLLEALRNRLAVVEPGALQAEEGPVRREGPRQGD